MKMRFPHDDEPEDPTANDCNYNFPTDEPDYACILLWGLLVCLFLL